MTEKNLNETDLIKRVKDTIRDNCMLKKGDKVLVAVSGGADSMCLLYVLHSIRKSIGIDISVATIDHGTRGEESREDSDHVKRTSKELGIRCAYKKLRLGVSSPSKISFEERAREERYKFFVRAARKEGSSAIATAHTLDDQAETVMMRVLTGSSLKGLGGIPPLRLEKGIKVIRPLIDVGKKDILNYLSRKGIKSRHDRTNDETKYLRNKVRIEILPFLSKYNPKINKALSNLSANVREDLELIGWVRNKALALPVKNSDGSISAPIKELVLQPEAVRKEVFRDMLGRAGGNLKKLTYDHWLFLNRLTLRGTKGKSLDLPGNVLVRRERSSIIFIGKG
ncbi:MAG: tRNA lysidine(34) synthetase TilS [Candidatus Omnitrophica bacterium]|nr:tRNA lysidine(34) synthetase TilS [Candidatus Omnitrophota bacterium]